MSQGLEGSSLRRHRRCRPRRRPVATSFIKIQHERHLPLKVYNIYIYMYVYSGRNWGPLC